MTKHIAIVGVYQITNTENGKFYIGSSNNVARRYAEHRKKMRAGISSCTRLQAAWDKYGERSFTFSVIEIVDDVNMLLQREQYWLDELKPAYNVSPSAGTQAGMRHSEATKALLSSINSGQRRSIAHRERISAGLLAMDPEIRAACSRKQSEAHKGNTYSFGQKQSAETRAKRVASLKGRIFTPEHRAKLSESRKGMVFSAEHKANMSAAKKKLRGMVQ